MINKNLINKEVQQFLRGKAGADVSRVALSVSPFTGVSSAELAGQLASRSKAEKKLPAFFTRENILYPVSLSMEQCSSEQTACYKASLVKQGARGADLTGGFGVDSLFFSDKFAHFDYFELHSELCEVVSHNFSVFGKENISVHCADGLSAVLNADKDYDFIFIDPARRDVSSRRVSGLEDCTPDVVPVAGKLLEKAPVVMLKASPMLDIQMGIGQLGQVSQVHVAALRGEVKELLFVMQKDFSDAPKIIATDLPGSQEHHEQIFSGTWAEKAPVTLAGGVKKYLYDPSASLRKASLQDAYAYSLGLEKLHPLTHLYTSDVRLDDFQGRAFEVAAVCRADKKELAGVLTGKQANVAVRNFPMRAEDMCKKMGLSDGGDDFVFAACLPGGKKGLVVCKSL